MLQTESTHRRYSPLLLSIHADYSSSHRHSPPRLPHTHRTSLKETASGGGSHTEAVHTWQKHHRLSVTRTNVFTCVPTKNTAKNTAKNTEGWHPQETRISWLSFLSTFEKITILFFLSGNSIQNLLLLQLAANPSQLGGDLNCEVTGISRESPRYNDLLSRYLIFWGIFFIIRE